MYNQFIVDNELFDTAKEVGEYIQDKLEIETDPQHISSVILRGLKRNNGIHTYKGIKIEAISDDIIDNINIIEEDDYSEQDYLDKNLTKFAKNKVLLQSLRNEINTHTTELGRLEVFNEYLIEEIKEYLDNHEDEIFEIRDINIKDDYTLYSVSDAHIGTLINLPHNYYDLDVAKSRLEELTQFIINDIETKQLKRIGIIFGGDNVEGSNLRISQLIKISQLIPGQTVEAIDIYEKMLRTISEYCEIDVYFTLYDNHGRLSLVTSNKDNVAENNMNIVIGNMLLRLLKDRDNINWYINDNIIVDINGIRLYINHGQKIPQNDSSYRKFFTKNNKIDFYIHGHYHSFRYTPMNDDYIDKAVISLPCICGPDDYSESILCSNKAASLRLTFNEDGISSIRKFTFTE